MSSDSTMHPVLHTLHDLGLAAWTGGSLMGSIGLNGAAATLTDPSERSRVSTRGWSRWAPVNAAGVAAHLVGASGLLVTDLPRIRRQEGVGRSSAVKTVTEAAALGVAAWSAVLNRKMAAYGPVPVAGATEPSAQTPSDVAATQKQLKLVQWLNPALGFALIAATAWQEEQQRTAQQVKGRLKALPGGGSGLAGLLAAAAGVGLLAARRRGSKGDTTTGTSTASLSSTPARSTTPTTTPRPAATPTSTTSTTTSTPTSTTTIAPTSTTGTPAAVIDLDQTTGATDRDGVDDLPGTQAHTVPSATGTVPTTGLRD